MTPAMAASRYEAQLYGRRQPGRAAGITIAVALHAIAILSLLQYEPARRALLDMAPIMVSLMTPIVEKPQELPKPLPVRQKLQQRPAETPPVLAAAAIEALAPYVASPPSAEPAAPAGPAILTPPAPVTPPNFSADYLQNPPPAYPGIARRLGQQGKVVLRVLVTVAGAPSQVEIRAGSGFQSLDEAALDAVRRWRFVPARQGAQAVAAWVLVPIVFTLER